MAGVPISSITVDTTPLGASRVVALEGSSTVTYTLASIAALFGVVLATANPTASDTAYANGTRWLNTTTGALFEMLDAGTGLWGALGASASLANHIGNTSNPHTVTATQVGLGNVPNLKVNLTATTDPGSGDDDGDGYAIGSTWVNTSSGTVFICVDATTGSASWVNTKASGSTVMTVSVTPGATWAPTLLDNTIYLVTLSEACVITFGSGVSGSDVYLSSIYLDRQGYAATIANADETDASVTLDAASGTVEMLAVEHRIVSAAKHYHLWQFGTEGAATADLPSSGLAEEWLFTTDATANRNGNDLTLRNSASIVGSGDHGLTLASASSQYADVAAGIINADSDFTVYVAFNHANSTSGSDEQVLGWGRQAAGGSYMDLYYDDGISKFRCITKDTTGVNGSGASVNYSDCPSGWQLWKLMRSGSSLTLTCLTNGITVTGTPPAGSMSLDALSFGSRYVNTSPSRYYNGVIGWAAMYTRAVTGGGEDATISDYVESVRSLNVIP